MVPLMNECLKIDLYIENELKQKVTEQGLSVGLRIELRNDGEK
jgi:hypothetical protein